MNYLITGGAGFIGSHLVDSLLADGAQVTVVDNFDPFYPRHLKLRNLVGACERPNFRLVEADICTPGSLEAAAGTYDCIVHLAGRGGVRPSIEDPIGYQRINVLGTQNVLEFARVCGVPQFVFASSSSVYGVNPNTPWTEDDHVLLPISPYAGSKVSGELLGHVYSHLHNIRFLALRFFTVYGPRQRPDLAIRKFAEKILAGRPIPIFGSGDSGRDYTFVGDIVAGIRAAIDYRASNYEVINLGNSHPIALMEMVSALECALNRKAVLEFLPEQPGDLPYTCAAIGKAHALLRYAPKMPFHQGMAQFAAWLTSAHPFRSSSTLDRHEFVR